MSLKPLRHIEKLGAPISSLAASGTYELGVIDLTLMRDFCLSFRATYHASASGTGALRVNLYYSPDGVNYDTVPYTYYDVTVNPGETVQRTVNIDVPPMGYLKTVVSNQDTTYAITSIMGWAAFARHGSKYVAAGEIARVRELGEKRQEPALYGYEGEVV